jgi:hypothetical protein
LQRKLWETADQLRANSGLSSSEYSTPVLGLIFLRYGDERFAEAHEEQAQCPMNATNRFLGKLGRPGGVDQMITPPRVEGTVKVGRGLRRLGFAEFGPADGRPLVWLHGTPGARRQTPQSARVVAEERGVRIVGIDRPGVGSSTPHRYGSLLDFTTDLAKVADHLGIERFGMIGLSGGGPYALASCYALRDRVTVAGVLGGVAPARGDDAPPGGSSDGSRPSDPWPRPSGRPCRWG